MKALLAAIFAVIAYGSLLAIPTNFNTGPFILGQGERGVPVEQWFSDPSKWQIDAQLPGPWTAAGDPNRLSQDNPGAVFGIEATQATVVKDATGAITEVLVTYSPAKAGTSKSGLLSRLKTSIGVFQGSTQWIQTSVAIISSTGKPLTVALRVDSASGNVTARLTRTA